MQTTCTQEEKRNRTSNDTRRCCLFRVIQGSPMKLLVYVLESLIHEGNIYCFQRQLLAESRDEIGLKLISNARLYSLGFRIHKKHIKHNSSQHTGRRQYTTQVCTFKIQNSTWNYRQPMHLITMSRINEYKGNSAFESNSLLNLFLTPSFCVWKNPSLYFPVFW